MTWGTKLSGCWAFGKSLVPSDSHYFHLANEGIGLSVLLSKFYQVWRFCDWQFGFSKGLPGVSELTRQIFAVCFISANPAQASSLCPLPCWCSGSQPIVYLGIAISLLACAPTSRAEKSTTGLM